MRDKILKALMLLAAITIFFVAFARFVGRSETVADYAKEHGQSVASEVVGPTVEAIPEAKVKADQNMEQEQKKSQNADDVRPTESTAKNGVQNENTTASGVQDNQKKMSENMNSTAEESGTRAQVVEKDSFYIEEISDELKESMRGKSYADNIDESIVNFDMLRHVVIMYNDFDGNSVQGELVCSELIAQDLLEIFEELYYAGYQLEEVALIDKYDADDDASMEANNTSCFNYRLVDRTTKLSYHAYGLAIDVNPFYNPYVEYKTNDDDYICPTQSVYYAYRDNEFPYKIDKNDLCYKLFMEHGFKWGGNWNSCKDYQHFEKRLR